jgi:hypothetical protein
VPRTDTDCGASYQWCLLSNYSGDMHEILKKLGITAVNTAVIRLEGMKDFLKKHSLIRKNYFVIPPLTNDTISIALII